MKYFIIVCLIVLLGSIGSTHHKEVNVLDQVLIKSHNILTMTIECRNLVNQR
jgi:hypothetical protein